MSVNAIPTKRAGHASAVLANIMYIGGGVNPFHQEFEKYTPATDVWMSVNAMVRDLHS